MITVPPWATASAALVALVLTVGLCEWVVHTIRKGLK